LNELSYRVLSNRKVKRDILNKFKADHGCIICGEGEICCLDFHHLNTMNKLYTIAEMLERHCSLKAILLEVYKCIVLCSNCHRKTHAGILCLPTIPYNYYSGLNDNISQITRLVPKCSLCGNTVSGVGKQCRKCSYATRFKTKWPNHAELVYWINHLGFSGTGRKYGVSDNAVRKRYMKYCA
jgi:hypothetical protein